MTMSARFLVTASAGAVLVIPPVVFLAAALGGGLSPAESTSALIDQYGVGRRNLAVIGSLGLFPVALLAVLLWAIRRYASDGPDRAALALGGSLPILAVVAWANATFWPLYLPSRTYPGFPHGLELVIGPLIFAPIGMALGVGLAWLAGRRRGDGGSNSGP